MFCYTEGEVKGTKNRGAEMKGKGGRDASESHEEMDEQKNEGENFHSCSRTIPGLHSVC